MHHFCLYLRRIAMRTNLIDPSCSHLKKLLHNEDACTSFLYTLKWPKGFVCPRCQHQQACTISTRRLPLYECRACHYQASLTVDTVMEGSRTPLWKWFTALWHLSRPHCSLNAVQLSAIIQVTYKTAWSMLHKIRTAINRADNARPLHGDVRGLLAFYGYHPISPFKERQHPVIVAHSVTPNGSTSALKMKMTRLTRPDHKILSYDEHQAFIDTHVAGSSMEPSINRYFYRIKRKDRLYQSSKQVWRWLNETFHGIGSKYLQLYLDEYCFRYNISYMYKSASELFCQFCRPLFTLSSISIPKLKRCA